MGSPRIYRFYAFLGSLLCAVSALPAPAQAFQLGQPELLSGFGQSLYAKVPIIAAAPGEIGGASVITAHLLSEGEASQLNLAAPTAAEDSVEVRVVASGDNYWIELSTLKGLREPVVVLQLEVVADGTRLIREVPLLFDLPAQGQDVSTTAVAAAHPGQAATQNGRPDRAAKPSAAPETATPVVLAQRPDAALSAPARAKRRVSHRARPAAMPPLHLSEVIAPAIAPAVNAPAATHPAPPVAAQPAATRPAAQASAVDAAAPGTAAVQAALPPPQPLAALPAAVRSAAAQPLAAAMAPVSAAGAYNWRDLLLAAMLGAFGVLCLQKGGAVLRAALARRPESVSGTEARGTDAVASGPAPALMPAQVQGPMRSGRPSRGSAAAPAASVEAGLAALRQRLAAVRSGLKTAQQRFWSDLVELQLDSGRLEAARGALAQLEGDLQKPAATLRVIRKRSGAA